MAALAAKAKARAKKPSSSSTLSKKAKSRPSSGGGEVIQAESVDDIERNEGLAPVPHMSDPMPFDKAPPLPPPLSYIRKLATIPALRKQE